MKTKWYESSPGNISSTRLMSMFWFWLSIPMLYIIISAIYKVATDPLIVFTWEKASILIAVFLIIILGWIAPKALKSLAEENGALSKMLADKGDKDKKE